MSARNRWVFAIVGLLAANIVAMVVLAVSAGSTDARVVPGYEIVRPVGRR